MKKILSLILSVVLMLSITGALQSGIPLVALATSVLGDINLDGRVDVRDYAKLILNYGTNNADCDIDGDGVVNMADLAILISNFGETLEQSSNWAKAEVDVAIAANLVPVALQSQYKANLTRSEFCDLIVKTIETIKGMTIADFIATVEGAVDKTFTDTTNPNVLAAAKLGIVNGRSADKFAPTAQITRQEAAKMLSLAAAVLGQDIAADVTTFADQDKVATWAVPFVAFCVKANIMNGISNSTFDPIGIYTREQAIITVLGLFSASNNLIFVNPRPPVYPTPTPTPIAT